MNACYHMIMYEDTGYKWKLPKVEKAFNDLLDVFSGGDNTRFVNFLSLVRDLDTQASNGDAASIELLNVIIKMSKLIDAAQKY